MSQNHHHRMVWDSMICSCKSDWLSQPTRTEYRVHHPVEVLEMEYNRKRWGQVRCRAWPGKSTLYHPLTPHLFLPKPSKFTSLPMCGSSFKHLITDLTQSQSTSALQNVPHTPPRHPCLSPAGALVLTSLDGFHAWTGGLRHCRDSPGRGLERMTPLPSP